jgi:hypothetical protein
MHHNQILLQSLPAGAYTVRVSLKLSNGDVVAVREPLHVVGSGPS